MTRANSALCAKSVTPSPSLSRTGAFSTDVKTSPSYVRSTISRPCHTNIPNSFEDSTEGSRWAGCSEFDKSTLGVDAKLGQASVRISIACRTRTGTSRNGCGCLLIMAYHERQNPLAPRRLWRGGTSRRILVRSSPVLTEAGVDEVLDMLMVREAWGRASGV